MKSNLNNQNKLNAEVTIYITNYNYGRYIEKAIKSCINQTFKNIDIVIIDDGSTDNSKNVIKQFSQKYKNIFVIFQKNKGLIKSCNRALYSAKGKYILRLDADDWLHKNAIKIMYNYLENNNRAEFVFSDYYEVNDKGKILFQYKRHNFNKVKMYDQPAHGACALFRTQTLKLMGGYDEKFTCQDGLDIWLRYIKKFQTYNINQPLFYYRQHNLSLTKNRGKILKNRNLILQKNNTKKKLSVALIPIRGVKFDKYSHEFKKLDGKYVIDWVIDEMLKSNKLSYIIVSSPDQNILKYVKKKNNPKLIPLKRSKELSKDIVRIEDSINQAIIFFQKKKKIKIDYFLVSKISNPFRDYRYLDNGLNAVEIFNFDILFGVRTDNKFYFQHKGNGLIPLRNSDSSFYKTNKKLNYSIKEEQEEIYKDSGGFIIYKVFKNKISELKNKKIGHEAIDSLSSFELDSNLNWLIAEQISKNILKYKKLI